MTCGADIVANELMGSLTAGMDFSVPDVNLEDPLFNLAPNTQGAMYSAIKSVDISDLTTRTIKGAGSFDALMESIGAHLREEYDKGRITGAEYTRVYAELVASAMENATQFVLNKDKVYWESQLAQITAVTALVKMNQAKVELAGMKFEALTSKSKFALSKIQLATEDNNYCISKYNLENMMPVQKDILLAQKEGHYISNDTAEYNLTNILPKQHEGLIKDNAGKNIANQTATYNLNSMLPSQKSLLDSQRMGQDIANQTATYNKDNILPAQLQLTKEQMETQRAQTLDTRTDGIPVVGYIGKQKDLFSQQIDSYKRDAEIKAAKLLTDGWSTQKTIDEETLTPTSFSHGSIDTVLGVVKANNGI